RVLRRLRADIAAARYGSSGIPSVKELSGLYGVSYRTLRKALAQLEAESLIVPASRGFRIRKEPTGPGRVSVKLVVRSSGSGRIETWAPRNKEQFRSLEYACAQGEVSLEIVPFHYEGMSMVGPGGSSELVLTPRELERTHGFMVWTQGLEGLELPRFVASLARYRRPIAILDSPGAFTLGVQGPAARVTRVFSMGQTKRCGADMARHLLALGHRHVAFVHHGSRSARYEGLCEVYDDAGLPGAVIDVSVGGDRAPSPPDDDRSRASLSKAIAALDKRVREEALLGRTLNKMAEHIHWEMVGEHRRALLQPALEGLLRRKEVTAWVGESDEVALHCLAFARGRGLAVPADVSIVGFDDIEESFLAGLTTYNFDVHGVVNTMLSHLLHPGQLPVRRHSAQPEELNGFVTVRETSGPCRP
ncbi:MAG: GntR family transcriptional regulator, partial [Chitinivibrionales bacterium]|nr:GntR family transcriptional regulator [Chitinivibrionales bacterium]